MKHLNKSIRKASKRVLDRLKHEATRTRRIRRNDGSVYSGKIDTDGDIKSSLKVSFDGRRIIVSANEQAEYWDKGVSGTKDKVKGGSPYSRKKAPRVETIRSWAEKKGIDESAAYPIAQKIKERGTAKTGFVTDTVEELLLNDKKIEDMLLDGLSDEIDEALDI